MCRSASACSAAQSRSSVRLGSSSLQFWAWLWLNSDHSRPATLQRSPAQPSPAPCTAEKMGDGNEGRGHEWERSRPGAQGCKEVERRAVT